jgi:hypothetical protein
VIKTASVHVSNIMRKLALPAASKPPPQPTVRFSQQG